jgi:hypothetical protein
MGGHFVWCIESKYMYVKLYMISHTCENVCMLLIFKVRGKMFELCVCVCRPDKESPGPADRDGVDAAQTQQPVQPSTSVCRAENLPRDAGLHEPVLASG